MTIAAAMTIATSIVAPTVAEPAANPGHALAQRFAEDTARARAAQAARKEAATKAAAQRRKEAAEKTAAERQKALQKKWEAEMLARAKAEADERRQLEIEASRLDAARLAREAKEAEAQQQRVEQARKAEEMQRAAEALRLAAERAAAEEARKAADARRIAEEKEQEARRIEAARLAEEARRAQNERLAEEGRRAEAARLEAVRKAEETARIAEEARRAEQAAWAAEEARRAEAQKRANDEAQQAVKRATEEEARRVGALEADAEIERIAGRLRVIREEHLARHMRPPETAKTETAKTEPVHVPTGGIGRLGIPAAPETARPIPAADLQPAADLPSRAYNAFSGGRVTVMLQMDPIAQRGRRHESMDPVLCLVDGCYVSNGPDYPASFLPGRRATRFGNAIGRRAGACNHAYTCVFRGVEIGALPAEVQPVDIRVLRHDRRAPETVDTLSTCRSSPGRLACTGAIRGDGYTMWVIPEAVAERLPLDLFGTTVESNHADAPPSALIPPRGRW